MMKKTPWSSIIDFATHPSFCDQGLYPRQQTLLRLIYLETENMTPYDLEVIEEWRQGFVRARGIYGVQPDIWERVEYLKRRGYRRFPHVQAVLGRRASKGFIGAILAAEQLAYLITLDNPQKHYSIREGKDLFLNVGATSQMQAQRHQFADIRDIVERCAWMQPYIAETKDHQMRLRTPADLRRIAAMRAKNVAIEHTIASLWVVALSASSVAGRGATAIANFFDEFAFHVQGSGSTKSGEEIYEDWQPALGQLKKDALAYIPSSPFTRTGKFFELYQHGRVLMNSYKDETGLSDEAVAEIRNMQSRADLDETELSADPTMLIFQGPSWAQPITTPVLTPAGWTEMGNLQAGDFVIGADGHPTKITETLRRGVEPAYRVTMNDGSSTRCSAEHLWSVQDWNERSGNMKSRNTVVSTADVAAILPGDPRHGRTFIPMIGTAPAFDGDDLPVPPYLMGYLLGDGCLRVNNSPRIALVAPEENALIEASLWEKFPEMRLVFHSGADWGIVSGYETPSSCSLCENPPLARGLCSGHYHRAKYLGEFHGQPKIRRNLLGEALRELGLMGVLGPDKFVPSQYFLSTPDQRLALLQGLMDSDGTYVKGRHSAVFFNTSRALSEAVVELSESLGGQARMYSRPARREGLLPSWHVSVRLPAPLNPFRLSRKATAYAGGVKTRQRSVPVRKIVSVEADGEAEMQCIEVSAEDGLYVTEHYIVTHNCLYQDYERGGELVGFQAEAAPEDDLTSEDQQRRKLRNPEKFSVEREGQFADVMGQYLDSAKVDAMFAPVPWRDPPVLVPTPFGRFDYVYRIHVDPSSTGANFALAVAHTELAPEDEFGERWPHVIFDRLHVWRASDFPINEETGKHQIDYISVERDLDEILYTFPSTSKFSSDQWNSIGLLQRLKKRYSPGIRVVEETATEKANYERAEKFKSAVNLGWLHAFPDGLNENGTSLLEAECKFLSERNGKVYKQDFGPVQTKDLYDCHDDQTEVLTEHGWKLFKDVVPGEQVATRTSEGVLEYQVPTRQIARHYQGQLVTCSVGKFDFAVTPTHRMLGVGATGRQRFVPAEEVASSGMFVPRLAEVGDRESGVISFDRPGGRLHMVDRDRCAAQRVKKTWSADQIQYLEENYATASMETLCTVLGFPRSPIYNRARKLGLKRGQVGDRYRGRRADLPDTKTVDFARFLGIWLAEGRKVRGIPGDSIILTQTKPDGIFWIDAMFSRLGWSVYRRLCPNGETLWSVNSHALKLFLLTCQGDGHELRIPDEVFTAWTKDEMTSLLEGLMVGDGSWSSQRDLHVKYTTSSHQLAGDVQRLMAHLGVASGRVRLSYEAGPAAGGRHKSNHAMWSVDVDHSKSCRLFADRLEYRSYDGMVYCLTVPNSTLLTRRNGVTLWSGNCASVVSVDLLHTALEKWEGGRMTAHSFGSSNVASLKTQLGEGSSRYAGGTDGRGRAWEALRGSQSDHRRNRQYTPDRARFISRDKKP